MPDKPLWLERLPQVINRLQERAEPWVDRATLELLLGVGRRRAQQLLAHIPSQRVGASILAGRTELIAHLKSIAAGQETYYEQRRRKRLWDRLEKVRQDWTEQPPVLVEVAQSQVRRIEVHDFDGLPDGVELSPGCITVRFNDPDEALQKLMALAMAVGQNRAVFEERVSLPRPQVAGHLYDL
jgi:hypothetical protein